MNEGLLSTAIFTPAAGALLLAVFGPFMTLHGVKLLGLGVAVLTLLLAGSLVPGFIAGAGFQFVDSVSWVPAWGISYHVGVDGVGLLMVLLTSFLMPVALLAGWSESTGRGKGATILVLFLETCLLGTFASLDLFLFYAFWEASLVPMYLVIGRWGSGQRVRAALKFLLFTLAGSVLMLAGIIGLAVLHQGRTGVLTFDFAVLAASRPAPDVQVWLYLAFLAAFLVKVPAVPLHTWLPDAHTEAPTAGSVILAGILLKMGGYGIFRFCLGLFPDAALEMRLLLSVLGVVGIVYGALMVMVQSDLKRLVAYSSVSHMGFVLAGLSSLTAAGLCGGVLGMVSHGLATGALFAIVGMLYARVHSRDLAAFGGVAVRLPNFAWALLLMALASMGFPGTAGFVSEFLVLLGLWKYRPLLAAIAVLAVILSAVYMLVMYRRIMHGPADRKAVLPPLELREGLVLALLAAGVLAIGIWPFPWLALVEPDVLAALGALGSAR